MAERKTNDELFQLKNYQWKFFLQGIEIPFMSIMLSYDQEGQFTINIPPVLEGVDIEPNSYGLVVFKNKKMSSIWHPLCEGIYSGPGYTKTPTRKSIALRFKDKMVFKCNKII